jgi:acyl-CoA dehydrogenase
MNFDLSGDSKLLKDQARRFLRERCPPAAARTVIEQGSPMNVAVWREMANLGWLGAAVPEEFGGAGMGEEALCVLAEELGYAVAPVPVLASTYLATTAILEFGSAEQKQELLPPVVRGEVIGTVALFEGLVTAPMPSTLRGRTASCEAPSCLFLMAPARTLFLFPATSRMAAHFVLSVRIIRAWKGRRSRQLIEHARLPI